MKTTTLDSREEIAKLDISNVLGSIDALPEQIQDAWEQAGKIDIPESYKDIKNIIVFGMGGSHLGTDVIKNLYKKELSVPIEIYSHYEPPAYINNESLVILSSYSGNTEEPVEVAEKHIAKMTDKIIVITSGGKLKEIAESNNYPAYYIDPIHNPSDQPRMAIGYAVSGQLAIFNKLGLIKVSDEQITTIVSALRKTAKNLVPENNENNTAKYLSYASFQKIIGIVSAEHLRGSAHVFNNQINENAKNLTIELTIPELNHHYMEGLSFPSSTKEDVIFLFFQSDLYHPRAKARFPLTQLMAEKQGYPTEMIQVTAPTKFEQAFELIQLGSFTNFYLAILNGLDPAPVPSVDFFKAELKKL